MSYTMRFFFFATAVVSVAAAFIPSSIHSSSTRTSTASQQRNHVSTASTRSLARRATVVAVREAGGGGGGETGDTDTKAVGVIVCDHGSRRENANKMLSEVAERYRTYSGFQIVEAAHMEIAEPSIEQAFDRCVAAGAEKVVLHPFFLSPGRHVTSDIPTLMNAAAKHHPEVAWVVSEPLGLQELMPRVMHAAVSESVAGGAWRHGDASGDDSK